MHKLKRMISAEAGTYAVSGLVVGIALGLVLNRKLYILLITHYFGGSMADAVGLSCRDCRSRAGGCGAGSI